MKQGQYVVVRGKSFGAFAGYFKKQKGNVVTLNDARRLWFWSGAASLSQLAEDGVSDPENCKFPKAVKEVKLFDVIEVIKASNQARESIEGVAEWKA